MAAEAINTTAAVTGSMGAGGFTVSDVHLTVRAKVPGAEEAAFMAAAQNAKETCPISKLLHGSIGITMDEAALWRHVAGSAPEIPYGRRMEPVRNPYGRSLPRG